MADQLLFLCRQDAGLQPGVQEVVAMDNMLQEVVGNMQLVGQEKGVAVSLGDNAACRLAADSGQLRRVFYNLIDNAIRYTEPAGRVTVCSRLTSDGLVVSIADTGAGIAPEHVPRIFDRFYRVDPARADGHGAGLGLAICQSIVKSLGGHISVESAVRQGTTVSVALPVSITDRRSGCA